MLKGVKNSRKRGRTVHLPSVDPDCHLVAHSLELGKFENCISTLSEPDNWGDLRQIVQPVADLVVKDFLGQHFVDDVRHRFDVIRYPSVNFEWPFIPCVMRWDDADGDMEVLKMLLAVGLDPDLSETHNLLRPSHLCGALARKDFAELIFPCRPSMKAVNRTGMTPLRAASERAIYPQLDVKKPQRKIRRKKVKNYIEASGFETRFPSLGELAMEESWFAVKNLVRRRVVAESEFTEKVEGRTAAEWAAFFEESGVAEEIRYYATSPSIRLDETAKQMTALVKKMCDDEDERSVLSSKVIKLEKEVVELKDETAAKDVKIEELSEAVSVFRTRLEEAGIEWELKKTNAPKSVPEEPESSVDSGCDVRCVGGPSSSNGWTTTK